MEWTIVLTLITLLGFGTAIITPILKLNKTLTELNMGVATLNAGLKESNDSNAKAHKRIWEHNDEQDKEIQDHEMRITILEKQ